MAAYAALISLNNTMEDIKNHPRLSTSLDKFQVECLSEKVGFFVDFMESYASHGGNKGVEDLESQIASAAQEAEDVIESYVADRVLSRFNQERSINISHLSCLFNLQKVVLDMDSTMEKVMKVKEKSGFKDQQPICWECATSSRSLTRGKTTMVGFDSYSTQLLDWLTGQQSGRQIISIVGMGGIGKTTLTKNAYEDSIVVWHFEARAWITGGLLRKSHWTVEFWKKVSGDISLIFHSEQNEQCLNVLSLSYNHLHVHLKPCFIYIGIFLEDEDIRVSRLIRLWVAEGFIKPNDAQILEDITEGYLKDIHDRNLILVSKRHRNGKIKTYRIHDLLRGLCLRIAEKQEFFCVARVHSIPQVIDRARRLVFLDFPLSFYNDQAHHALQSKSHVRSLICKGVDLSIKPRLLRVLDRASHCSLDVEFHNVNLRYFAYQPQRASAESMLSSFVSLVWNLQTLIIRGKGPSEKIAAPSEIWKMPQLRHIECDEIYFPDPPQSGKQDHLFVLEKLQTLQRVVNFRLRVEVYTRIPNVKKLYIIYDDTWKGYDDSLCDTLQS